MLDKLENVLEILPNLLSKFENWDSLIVNRRKPHTYRVFTQLPDESRICLHKFNPCDRHEAFMHPHPWAGAFMVLRGSYKMQLGYTVDRKSRDVINIADLLLTKWSRYEITSPLTWHSVTPLEVTYTVMVNEQPWAADFAHEAVRTTKGKDLDKMPENELIEHLGTFSGLLADYKVEKYFDKYRKLEESQTWPNLEEKK